MYLLHKSEYFDEEFTRHGSFLYIFPRDMVACYYTVVHTWRYAKSQVQVDFYIVQKVNPTYYISKI